MDIREALNIIRDMVGSTYRPSNQQAIQKLDVLEKGGPGSGRYPAGSGGSTASSAQRTNARQDKIFEEARRLEIERMARGEKPNPNLTDLVTSRTHIAGEHNIYATKKPDGDYVYSVRYKPSAMFEYAGHKEQNLGTHRDAAQAHNIIDAHKESLIADWNAKAKANKGELISDMEKGGSGSGSWEGPNSPRFAHQGKLNEAIHNAGELRATANHGDYHVLSVPRKDGGTTHITSYTPKGKTESNVIGIHPNEEGVMARISDHHAAYAGKGDQLTLPDMPGKEYNAEDEKLGEASRLTEEAKYADPSYNPPMEERNKFSEPKNMVKMWDTLKDAASRIVKGGSIAKQTDQELIDDARELGWEGDDNDVEGAQEFLDNYNEKMMKHPKEGENN